MNLYEASYILSRVTPKQDVDGNYHITITPEELDQARSFDTDATFMARYIRRMGANIEEKK